MVARNGSCDNLKYSWTLEPWCDRKFQNEWGFKGILKMIKSEPVQQDAHTHWMANAENKNMGHK